jgi:sugar lactone lactonase YvrE
MNEGACDPDGRFYCGSMGYQHQRGGGALWRLDPDRSAHLVLDQVTVSNGLDWSPDGARAGQEGHRMHVRRPAPGRAVHYHVP